ncbi:glycine zipper family protein [Flavobacterium sp. WG21]|uniref:glycine zipper family protein n=1 Tax=Flavobacterium sp. WG21 TaxID=1229487 RepID=UPI000347FCFC|nr:glycine zipper family protein [Flavobacterium sp. WG21]
MKALYIFIAAVFLVSCQNQGKEDINKAKQASIDSMKVEISKQRVIDSMRTEMAKIREEQKVEAQQKLETQKVVVVNQKADVTPTATQTTPKKKGWSSAAKGAVIGAGVGAVTGAIVSKRKGEGAIIGGLAGAGVGAGTGAIIDGSKKKKE